MHIAILRWSHEVLTPSIHITTISNCCVFEIVSQQVDHLLLDFQLPSRPGRSFKK